MQANAAEREALGEYSPCIGEEAPPLKKAGPQKSKIHLMGPSQYLSALGKCSAELETHVSSILQRVFLWVLNLAHVFDASSLEQGLDAVWVGGGQDTFYQALGVQLQNAGITRPVGSTGSTSAPNGYDFTPSTEVIQTSLLL